MESRIDTNTRRSFLSRAGAGAAAFLAVFRGTPTAAAASASSPFEPARHTEDDWFDQPAAKHKLFIDTTNPGAFGQAIAWSRNFFEASASGYGLTDADTAIIICARHFSTPFAYTDAMWAKYGADFSERLEGFVDPKTKQAPKTNVYLASDYGEALRNTGFPLNDVLKRGVRLAVCGMATKRFAGLVAKKHGSSADEVFKELCGNLVPNSHIVPAGIVAVNRAQERGFTAATVV
jgi:hypothetical protein